MSDFLDEGDIFASRKLWLFEAEEKCFKTQGPSASTD
jgi:hypothetical protein